MVVNVSQGLANDLNEKCTNFDITDCILRDMSSHDVLTRSKEKELGPYILRKEQWAVDALIVANFKLIISTVKRYQGRCGDFQLVDLIQAGYFGLVEAAHRFDYRKGYKFSTYATYWIRQSATRAFKNEGNLIRKPIHVTEKLAKLYDAYGYFLEKGVIPTIDDLSKHLKIPKASIINVITSSKFHELIGSDDNQDDAIVDIDRRSYIHDESVFNPEQKLVAKDEVRVICKKINKSLKLGLSSRNRQIIIMRCGIDADFEIRTLEDVAQKFGLTRERVRQILCKFFRTHSYQKESFDKKTVFESDKSLEAVMPRLIYLAEIAGLDHDDLRRMILT